MGKKTDVSVFLKGILLGLVSVGIPGLSASTVGIVVGIYFLMVEAIAGIFEDFKHNFVFLIVLIGGYSLGAIIAAFAVTALFAKFALATTVAVIGLILGGVSSMKDDLKEGKNKVSCWVTMGVLIVLILLYNFFAGVGDTAQFPTEPTFGYLLEMFLIGVVTSATFVIPGVDFAVVFLSIGFYLPFMKMITELFSFDLAVYQETFVKNIEIALFYFAGYLIGMFLFSKLIKKLSQRFAIQMQYASFAFVAVAPIIVLKNCIFDNTAFTFSPLQLIVGIGVGIGLFFAMAGINQKAKEKKE